MKRLFGILFFGLLLNSSPLFSQKKLIYSAVFQKGIIVPHHKSINYLIKDYIYGIDLNFGKQTTGTKDWHSV
jgi:hypothetical protein